MFTSVIFIVKAFHLLCCYTYTKISSPVIAASHLRIAHEPLYCAYISFIPLQVAGQLLYCVFISSGRLKVAGQLLCCACTSSSRFKIAGKLPHCTLPPSTHSQVAGRLCFNIYTTSTHLSLARCQFSSVSAREACTSMTSAQHHSKNWPIT